MFLGKLPFSLLLLMIVSKKSCWEYVTRLLEDYEGEVRKDKAICVVEEIIKMCKIYESYNGTHNRFLLYPVNFESLDQFESRLKGICSENTTTKDLEKHVEERVDFYQRKYFAKYGSEENELIIIRLRDLIKSGKDSYLRGSRDRCNISYFEVPGYNYLSDYDNMWF